MKTTKESGSLPDGKRLYRFKGETDKEWSQRLARARMLVQQELRRQKDRRVEPESPIRKFLRVFGD